MKKATTKKASKRTTPRNKCRIEVVENEIARIRCYALDFDDCGYHRAKCDGLLSRSLCNNPVAKYKALDTLLTSVSKEKLAEQLSSEREEATMKQRQWIDADRSEIIHAIAEAVRAVCGLDDPSAEVVRELAMDCKRLADSLHEQQLSEVKP